MALFILFVGYNVHSTAPQSCTSTLHIHHAVTCAFDSLAVQSEPKRQSREGQGHISQPYTLEFMPYVFFQAEVTYNKVESSRNLFLPQTQVIHTGQVNARSSFHWVGFHHASACLSSHDGVSHDLCRQRRVTVQLEVHTISKRAAHLWSPS